MRPQSQPPPNAWTNVFVIRWFSAKRNRPTFRRVVREKSAVIRLLIGVRFLILFSFDLIFLHLFFFYYYFGVRSGFYFLFVAPVCLRTIHNSRGNNYRITNYGNERQQSVFTAAGSKHIQSGHTRFDGRRRSPRILDRMFSTSYFEIRCAGCTIAKRWSNCRSKSTTVSLFDLRSRTDQVDLHSDEFEKRFRVWLD